MADQGAPRERASVVYKKIAAKAREDINVFIEFVFRIKQADCHRELQAHMDAHNRAGVVSQRELGKTTQCVARVLFLLGQNPNLRVKIICSDDKTASDRVVLCRDMIDRNKWLHLVFPHLKRSLTVDNWGKYSLTVERELFSKDSSLEGCGVLTAGIGQRADYILFDDVVNFQNAVQHPSERELVKRAFKNVWIPLLGPDGKAAYISNRHHEDDLTHELEQNRAWRFIDMSVTGEPPVSKWPERWTTNALLERQAEIGTLEFDRTMRNLLHSDADRIIKEHWIHRFASCEKRGDLRIAAWDYGGSSEDSDDTARAIVDVFYVEKLIRVMHVTKWPKLGYNGIIETMLADFAEWTPDLVIDEQTGFQIVIGSDERCSLMPMEHVVPKFKKEERVRMTAVAYEHGRILFREGTCESGITNLINFPQVVHDDETDAITYAVTKGIQMLGLSFSAKDLKGSGVRAFSQGTEMSIGYTKKLEDGEVHQSHRANFRSARW